MRQLPKRPSLPGATNARLKKESQAISGHANSKEEAARRYSNARKAVWFSAVVNSLKKMTGPGQRCMFCSGSESTDVEHYKPKSVFPDLALTWENYLWSCTPCNRGKGNRFPPQTEPGGMLVNPVEENAWDFFFIDEFGLLTPVWDKKAGTPDERAVSTMEILDLNREAVQETRLFRLNDLKRQVSESLALFKSGTLSRQMMRQRLDEWLVQPFQPDVADYFFNGPGREEKPFSEFISCL